MSQSSYSFAKRLIMLRHEKHMTQAQLGACLNRDSPRSGEVTVQHYEHGRQEPNLRDLRALAEALKCSLDDLVP